MASVPHGPLCDKTCEDFADHANHRCCKLCKGDTPWPTQEEPATAGTRPVDVATLADLVLIALEKLDLIEDAVIHEKWESQGSES